MDHTGDIQGTPLGNRGDKREPGFRRDPRQRGLGDDDWIDGFTLTELPKLASTHRMSDALDKRRETTR